MIKVICGDITKLKVDAIVNAANSELRPGGGVDGAIRRAAGHELNEACERLGGCPVGEVRMTLGFHLPAKYVIHTVGPVWHGGDQGEADLLRRCYRESFKAAMDKDLQTIAFPCISTGIYGYPKQQAAVIAVKEMQAFENRFAEIIACCHSEEDQKIYREILAR
jgi:O-acetyl-ADP-ribose deacetylase (regulator of RNase III)